MNRQTQYPDHVAPISQVGNGRRRADPVEQNLVMLQFDLWQLRQRIKIEEMIKRAVAAYVTRNGGRPL